jgi:hypothetical protein
MEEFMGDKRKSATDRLRRIKALFDESRAASPLGRGARCPGVERSAAVDGPADVLAGRVAEGTGLGTGATVGGWAQLGASVPLLRPHAIHGDPGNHDSDVPSGWMGTSKTSNVSRAAIVSGGSLSVGSAKAAADVTTRMIAVTSRTGPTRCVKG